jgi:hypothetical protein
MWQMNIGTKRLIGEMVNDFIDSHLHIELPIYRLGSPPLVWGLIILFNY